MKSSPLWLTVVALGLSPSILAQKVDWSPRHENPTPPEEELASVEKALPEEAVAEPDSPRKLLVYSATSGFRHNSITLGRVALERLGAATGAYEAVVSDQLENFEPEALKQFDAVLMLNSTGDFFMPGGNMKSEFTEEEWSWLQDRHKRLIGNLVSYVENGGGLAGIHAATDACKDDHNYTEAIGGIFDSHPWNADAEVTIVVTEPEHAIIEPVFEGMEDFRIRDEIYQFREGTASPDKLRILLNLDPDRSDPTRDEPKRGRNDLPVCWVQKVGEGRVFYTSLGHRRDIYWNPLILKHYLAGLQFALGDIDAETDPSQEINLPKLDN